LDQPTSYAVVATTRAKEMGARIGLGAIIGLAALALAPSWAPLAWFAVMVLGQIVDRWIAQPLIGEIDRAARGGRIRAYLCSSVANAAIFGLMNIYLWFRCGEPGQWFALLAACGGLLHASLRLYPSRAMLLACSAPHAAYLLGLPIVFTLLTPHASYLGAVMVVLGGAVYIAHLMSGARQSHSALLSLRAANGEAILAREHAERASAAKSEFLATVSHEIRTPMNAVLSAGHLLRRTDLTAEQAEHVAMLTDAGEVLMSLLNDVLDISKIEAGKMEIEEAVLDLQNGLGALIRLWEPQAQAKSVRLVLDAAKDLPAAVRTDPLRLRQILFNLLSNAVKFTEEGQITLCAGRVDSLGGERLWFEIRDTGCGITEEAQSRLFGSFEQAHVGDARRFGGTGLGLSISRRLAEMMGGTLTASSVLGQGSVFRLELPLVAADLDEMVIDADGEIPDADGGRPLSILVAEDHEVNRRIVGMFLGPLGWRLTMVENGLEAVEAARLQPFDVILMDMQMPVMSGVEAARTIRDGHGVNAATPIVALTANALGHHREIWAEVGVADFLTKPIDPRLLVATLLAASARRGARPATQAA
jgi:signal transduction histidine kinase/CheY-like chemotaxis protein